MIPPLSITVGPRNAQLTGVDDRILQAGVDYLAGLGGGTLRILPGTFHLNNAVYLRDNIRVEGSGDDTVLMKNPSLRAKLAEDADWYLDEIVLDDPKGFDVGYGVCLQGTNPHNNSVDVIKRTLVARDGNRFKLDRQIEKNFWTDFDATAATLFPIISGDHVRDCEIRNLTLDGNRDNNEEINGNYAGGIFLQNCQNLTFDAVTSRNYNGDGFSWQIAHDVTVTNCKSLNNANLGLHPGSGSLRPIMKNNVIENTDIGIFFCWGVKNGVAENNLVQGVKSAGISIGHRDTDNVVRANRVVRSGKVGVLFRAERSEAQCGHRNLIEDNDIIDSGAPADGVAIDVQGQTRQITLRNNRLKETRSADHRVGVRIGPETADITLDQNTLRGFANNVDDQRKK
jgi:hypothetical protein